MLNERPKIGDKDKDLSFGLPGREGLTPAKSAENMFLVYLGSEGFADVENTESSAKNLLDYLKKMIAGGNRETSFILLKKIFDEIN